MSTCNYFLNLNQTQSVEGHLFPPQRLVTRFSKATVGSRPSRWLAFPLPQIIVKLIPLPGESVLT